MKSLSQISLFLFAIVSTTFTARAASVTVNLGSSAQNFTMVSTGPNGSGLGTYTVTPGACSPSNGNTTCTLSGTFTGTTPGFTSGTYSFVTVYPGTGTTPLLGVQQAAGSNFFLYSSVPQSATQTLTLTSASGTLAVPILLNSQFVNIAGFIYDASAVCTVVAPQNCSVSQIGQTAGATITGPVIGSATFDAAVSYYLPQVAFSGNYTNSGLYQTTLTYVNYSPQTVTCVTKFYSDAGTPLSVPFASGTVSTRTDTLAPGGSIHDATIAPLASPVQQGWAQANCTSQIQASLLYRYYQGTTPVGEAGVNAETGATTQFSTFAQTNTGIAYANPSPTTPASVTITALSATGTKLGSSTFTLGPLQHGAANIGPLLGISSFTGSLLVTSSSPIISLSLNFETAPIFSSLPPGDLPSTTSLVTP